MITLQGLVFTVSCSLSQNVPSRKFCSAKLTAIIELLQSSDHYLEMPSIQGTASQDKEGSEMTQAALDISDGEESGNHDDDEKSVDVFFEDISASLIDISKERANSSSLCGSIISNPLESEF